MLDVREDDRTTGAPGSAVGSRAAVDVAIGCVRCPRALPGHCRLLHCSGLCRRDWHTALQQTVGIVVFFKV